LVEWQHLPKANAIVAAVAHSEFVERPLDALLAKLAPGGVYVDVKSQADRAALEARGVHVWRL
jgi:UDP-N-acetyl-D-galactosamine dehydrogenase